MSMRIFVTSLAVIVTGCGSRGGDDAGNGNDSGSPDAGSDAGAPDAGPLAMGFTITTPRLSIDAGEPVTQYCYFFRTPNTAPQAVRGWHSSATAAVQYLAVWLTASDVMPPGTFTAGGCDQNIATEAWAYSAWTADAGWAFPPDDGTGQPIGKLLGANQAGYVYLQVTNATDMQLDAQARLEVDLYAPDAGVTQAEPFVTYNSSIDVAAGGMSTASMTCPAPPGARFTRMSVFTHRYATQASVLEGSTTVFNTTTWEDPGASTWSAPSFFTPTAQLEYRCSYFNPTSRTVRSGPSPVDDETCMVLSYFFPATRPRACLNNQLLP